MESTLIYSSYTTVVSPQGQITIPIAIRRLLKLTPGTSLSVMVKKANRDRAAIIAYSRPKNPIDAYYALGKDAYKRWGGADAIIRKERESWGNR